MAVADDRISVRASEPPRSRKFSVYDLMVAVVGVALFLASDTRQLAGLIQQFTGMIQAIIGVVFFFALDIGLIDIQQFAILVQAFTEFFDLPLSWIRRFRIGDVALYWSGVLWFCVRVSEQALLVMSLVFLLIRLRRPRPSLRALLGQPGTVAALAVVLGSILVVGWLHLLFVGLHPRTITPVALGGTVAFAWACLALGRKWEAERSWIDRFGRMLGFMAIGFGLLSLLNYGI